MFRRYLPFFMIGFAILTTVVVTLAVTIATRRLSPNGPVLPFLKGEADEPTDAVELLSPAIEE